MNLPTSSIFVSAIGTDSGKTICSALLCNLLSYDYWKPIQTGVGSGDVSASLSDKVTVKELAPNSTIYPEHYVFPDPLSPHAAAENCREIIDLHSIKIPKQDKLIVEGAGGLLVPLNQEHLMVDLIEKLELPIFLVVDFYLGSINHTLLSLSYLENSPIKVLGLIFNGEVTDSSASIILENSRFPLLLSVPKFQPLDRFSISKFTDQEKVDFCRKVGNRLAELV